MNPPPACALAWFRPITSAPRTEDNTRCPRPHPRRRHRRPRAAGPGRLHPGRPGADTTTTHAYSNFGEVKYGPDFAHLDYVNPDAPKGGEFSMATIGTFDSFNQYARDGVAAALNMIGSESILIGTADDAYGVYCYLCTTMEYPDDQKWVIFHLRDDVTSPTAPR
ncbi:MAG: hypothetical protein R3D59_16640 [Paracoccaceae bacterium]